MKKILVVLTTLVSLVALPLLVQAQEKKEPQNKMVEFHMALLKRGPKWSAKGMSPEVQKAHMVHVLSLLDSGKAVIAGPMGDEGDLVGIYILRAKSAEEAKGWADSDPAVTSGDLIPEMHPWWSEEVMQKASTPMKLTTAYIGFLSRGPKWTPEKTPATAALQQAHLANINRLAEAKKLVVAGPFGDNGTLRGIFVFKVASLAEAKQLAETDPAVIAGRLAIDMHPWKVPEGILP
ncbi:MAG TPA: YciI family protein [Pyrinomonadaceae bacterium]|nr:YciI family protein [Pyrinomonadaceae bacterium]